MFISSELLDEETFPLAYFIIFSLNKELEKNGKDRFLKSENQFLSDLTAETLSLELKGRSMSNDYNFIKMKTGEICQHNGYYLRAFSIINRRVWMVVSERLDSQKNFNSDGCGINIKNFFDKILSRIEGFKEIENFDFLWKKQELDSVIRAVLESV